MLEHTPKYVAECLRVGILTEEKIREYPLRPANLAMLLKLYAIETQKPYGIDVLRFSELDRYVLYMTDDGLEWMIRSLKNHSIEFLQRTLQFMFLGIDSVDELPLTNFKGEKGIKPKAGTRQAAVLVRHHKRARREFHFETLREARAELLKLTRFYPIDEFKLYRVRKDTRGGKTTYYREEVRTVLPPSKRGIAQGFQNRRSS
jgi:hypothetical protein